VLLDGRRGHGLGFDIGGDVQRPDRGELKIVLFAPAEELRCSLNVSRACVFVSDDSGEEFEEMFAGLAAGGRDDGRHRKFGWKHGGGNFDAWLFHKLHICWLRKPNAPYRDLADRSIRLRPTTSFMGLNPSSSKWFTFIND
jgi:hypothetical protein